MSNQKKLISLCNGLLKEKDQEQEDPKCIKLILRYNRFLPNLTAVVHKNMEHPPPQHKSTGIIPRTSDRSL